MIGASEIPLLPLAWRLRRPAPSTPRAVGGAARSSGRRPLAPGRPGAAAHGGGGPRRSRRLPFLRLRDRPTRPTTCSPSWSAVSDAARPVWVVIPARDERRPSGRPLRRCAAAAHVAGGPAPRGRRRPLHRCDGRDRAGRGGPVDARRRRGDRRPRRRRRLGSPHGPGPRRPRRTRRRRGARADRLHRRPIRSSQSTGSQRCAPRRRGAPRHRGRHPPRPVSRCAPHRRARAAAHPTAACRPAHVAGGRASALRCGQPRLLGEPLAAIGPLPAPPPSRTMRSASSSRPAASHPARRVVPRDDERAPGRPSRRGLAHALRDDATRLGLRG